MRDLLEHCGGLTAWMPFYRDHQGRADIETAICTLPLEYAPWTQSLYSDLGFMLLGFILETSGGDRLDRQFAVVADALDVDLRFGAPVEWRARTAPTEIDPWRGRLLVGEVHDENAWALGGVAGHAGLFGTAAGSRRVRATLCCNDPRRHARWRGTTRSRASRRAARSRQLARARVGHDAPDLVLRHAVVATRVRPYRLHRHVALDRSGGDLYVVLLTNRVHPTRANPRLAALRAHIHDAVVEEFG